MIQAMKFVCVRAREKAGADVSTAGNFRNWENSISNQARELYPRDAGIQSLVSTGTKPKRA